MEPTQVSVESFLAGVSEKRLDEARILIDMMQEISGETPTMWGPSIIGFGSLHYRYDTGHEGDMPRLAFSPRKANLTVYFDFGEGRHADELRVLGKHKQSVACLYINTLDDVDLDVLETMLEDSFAMTQQPYRYRGRDHTPQS